MSSHEQAASTIADQLATEDLVVRADLVDQLESEQDVVPDDDESQAGGGAELTLEADPADVLEQAQEIGYGDEPDVAT